MFCSRIESDLRCFCIESIHVFDQHDIQPTTCHLEHASFWIQYFQARQLQSPTFLLMYDVKIEAFDPGRH